MGLNFTVVTLTLGVGGVASPESGVLGELSLGNRLNSLEDSPLDTLSARGSGEGTIVAPEIVFVEGVEETFNIDLLVGACVTGSGKNAFKLVKEKVITVTTFSSIEKHSNDSSEGSVHVGVNEVHLKIHVLAIDLMLGWCVNVELGNLELTGGEGIESKLHLTETDCDLDSVIFFLDGRGSVIDVGVGDEVKAETPGVLDGGVEVDG